jgi:hypothetical protein
VVGLQREMTKRDHQSLIELNEGLAEHGKQQGDTVMMSC